MKTAIRAMGAMAYNTLIILWCLAMFAAAFKSSYALTNALIFWDGNWFNAICIGLVNWFYGMIAFAIFLWTKEGKAFMSPKGDS